MARFGIVPRFGGHGSIRFRYKRKKKCNLLCSGSFHLFEQTAVQITIVLHLDVKILLINTNTRFKVQGFFICHIINYTGYNQK